MVQKLRERHREDGDLISLTFLFKESRQKYADLKSKVNHMLNGQYHQNRNM